MARRSVETLKFLIDTGSNKNYIKKRYIRNSIKNIKSFYATSVGGKTLISHHSLVNLFYFVPQKLKFFILPTLTSFDGIIGNDSLKELAAVIHTDENYMTIFSDFIIPLKQQISNSVNTIKIRDLHMSSIQKINLNNIIQKCPKLFADPDEKLTYTSTV